MQFSVGVEYAFHSLFYMIDLPGKKVIGIKDLARFNRLPETYLSKVFTKLRKVGIVRSVPGVNGGYELAKDPDNISFWDVIEAIEGPSNYFQCAEIRKNNILVDDPHVFSANCPCLIKVVISEAEEEMRKYLRKKSLGWLHATVYKSFSEDKKRAISEWFSAL
jgi:Rrf2 family protein